MIKYLMFSAKCPVCKQDNAISIHYSVYCGKQTISVAHVWDMKFPEKKGCWKLCEDIENSFKPELLINNVIDFEKMAFDDDKRERVKNKSGLEIYAIKDSKKYFKETK